jgi:hypothetical protein
LLDTVRHLQRLLASSALGYALLLWLGRACGSTAAERATALPGDEIVLASQVVTDRLEPDKSLVLHSTSHLPANGGGIARLPSTGRGRSCRLLRGVKQRARVASSTADARFASTERLRSTG